MPIAEYQPAYKVGILHHVTFLETAGSSLLGVAVGGAITYVTQSRIDRRRDQRAHERERRADKRDRDTAHAMTQMAARLVFLDLYRLVAQLRATRETGKWWSRLVLADGAWRGHSELLSHRLKDKEWREVAAVFAVAAEWNAIMAAGPGLSSTIDLKRMGLATLRDDMLDAAPIAMEALRPIALPTTDDTDPLSRWATGDESSPHAHRGGPTTGGGIARG